MSILTIGSIGPEREGLVTAAIMQLSAEHKTVLGLWYLEELQAEEIADLLGISAERVMAVLDEALDRVRAAAA